MDVTFGQPLLSGDRYFGNSTVLYLIRRVPDLMQGLEFSLIVQHERKKKINRTK